MCLLALHGRDCAAAVLPVDRMSSPTSAKTGAARCLGGFGQPPPPPRRPPPSSRAFASFTFRRGPSTPAVELLDRVLCLDVRAHLDEREPTRLAAELVGDDGDRLADPACANSSSRSLSVTSKTRDCRRTASFPSANSSCWHRETKAPSLRRNCRTGCALVHLIPGAQRVVDCRVCLIVGCGRLSEAKCGRTTRAEQSELTDASTYPSDRYRSSAKPPVGGTAPSQGAA